MPPRAKPPKMSLAEAMSALEEAGSEQTRKTYTRHGIPGPMFGVSFATLKALVKRIKVDHELALALWATGNHDARMLAVKVADPARMASDELDAWASVSMGRGCNSYVPMLVVEGGQGLARAEVWLAAEDPAQRRAGWLLVGELAMTDESVPDVWFEARIREIEAGIHAAPNAWREAMLSALISIGCRSDRLRDLGLAAGRRIGPVEIDHGDTDCKTAVVADSVTKAWDYSTGKGHPSPAAHERTRESRRTRC